MLFVCLLLCVLLSSPALTLKVNFHLMSYFSSRSVVRAFNLGKPFRPLCPRPLPHSVSAPSFAGMMTIAEPPTISATSRLFFVYSNLPHKGVNLHAYTAIISIGPVRRQTFAMLSTHALICNCQNGPVELGYSSRTKLRSNYIARCAVLLCCADIRFFLPRCDMCNLKLIGSLWSNGLIGHAALRSLPG